MNLFKHSIFIYHAYATGNCSILTDRILQNKSSHAHLHLICCLCVRNQVIMEKLKRFLSIIIICIDDHKRFFYYIFTTQDCLTGSPRFGTSLRNFKTSWNICKILIYIFHLDLISDTIPDYRTEFFFNIFSDNKYNLVKTSFFCIINRVIHNDLPIRRHLGELLDSCSKS